MTTDMANYGIELVGYNLMGLAVVFSIVITSMILLACYFCHLIKESVRKEEDYLIALAKSKGIKLDLEALKPITSPEMQDKLNSEHSCPVAVPNIGIFVS